MRIERLKINEFRGIPELEIEPGGDNLCLVGPNGSGKSSVIEAIDFLLTGDVQDLSGEGTGDISIREHGPYLRGNLEDAWVEGTFTDDGETVTVKRRLADRNTLEHEGALPRSIENLMDSASKGQHYLSRREILNFIVARKQSRSDQLRSLLNLSTIRDKRLELQGAADNLDTQASQLEREQDSSRDRLLDLFEQAESVDGVLQRVNELRGELDGEPLDELAEDTPFRSNLESPTDRASASPLQSNRTKELLETISEWFDETESSFWDDYESILSKVDEVRDNEEALRDLEELDLIRRGKDSIDENTTECPLCLTAWEARELQSLLDQREAQAQEAKEVREDIEGIREDLLSKLTPLRTAVESLVDILDQHDEFDTEQLTSFQKELNELEEGFGGDLVEEVPLEDLNQAAREDLLAPPAVESEITQYRKRADELPDFDRLEEIWDDLLTGFETYKEYLDLQEQATKVREAADEMEAVKDEFVDARDQVLTDTYDAISAKFEQFYTTLHHDEGDFSPRIEPTETGLDIQVGFHGEGKHPPHALHSEGHQDSMGLCLFLALCDYLEGDDLSIIMLDDVVMSIDAQHRRPLAKLLNEDISTDYQLLITTHDELWYRHLKTEGVVSSRNTVKFTSWSIGDGPVRVDQLADGWARIDELLEDGDVPGAAHRLRHTAEWFLREVCHQLNADVQFKADGLWSLGDFMGPAMSKFKSLLKTAKVAESSWGNDISDINDLDDRRSEIYQQLNMEQGAVNPNVHFNEDEWATFTASEMQNVVDAFRDLYDLFLCSNCGSCLRVSEQDFKEVDLRCTCGQKANWTLEEQAQPE